MSNMGKDSQHHPQEALEGRKQGWQGVGWVGTTRLQEKHRACTFAGSSAWRSLQKRYLKITTPSHYPDAFFALRVQSDGECCSTGNIMGKWNRLRSDSPVSSAHLSLQRQILKIAQQPQNKQDFQRFLLVTTAKRLGLPKAGGRAAGCSPPLEIIYSGYKSPDENWILTFFKTQPTQCLGGGWSCKDLTSTGS